MWSLAGRDAREMLVEMVENEQTMRRNNARRMLSTTEAVRVARGGGIEWK
jgi:hypothetical protein